MFLDKEEDMAVSSSREPTSRVKSVNLCIWSHSLCVMMLEQAETWGDASLSMGVTFSAAVIFRSIIEEDLEDVRLHSFRNSTEGRKSVICNKYSIFDLLYWQREEHLQIVHSTPSYLQRWIAFQIMSWNIQFSSLQKAVTMEMESN